MMEHYAESRDEHRACARAHARACEEDVADETDTKNDDHDETAAMTTAMRTQTTPTTMAMIRESSQLVSLRVRGPIAAHPL